MKLEATVREAGSAAALRSQGRLPAVVYNQKLNVAISVDERTFDKVFRSQGTSNLIDLEIDGTTHSVLVKAVQMNKRSRVAQHVDFFAITAGQAVSLHVPIELVGTAAGSRDGGQLDIQRREVHISVLPRHIPEHLAIDISALQIGDSLHVSDLRSLLPAEADILDDLELAIVTVVPPRVAVEDESGEGEASEPEVIGAADDEASEG